MTFIAPNGKLYFESKRFFKASMLITGICVTELWCDAYSLNARSNEPHVLIYGELSEMYNILPVVDHAYCKKEFIEKGGGFRIDFNC